MKFGLAGSAAWTKNVLNDTNTNKEHVPCSAVRSSYEDTIPTLLFIIITY